MDQARNVSARFNVFVADVTVSVAKQSNGSGSVSSAIAGLACGNTCSSSQASVAPGTLVTLNATPANGSSFGGWGGPCAACMLWLSDDLTAHPKDAFTAFLQVQRFELQQRRDKSRSSAIPSWRVF